MSYYNTHHIMLVGQHITDDTLKRSIMASIPYRSPCSFNASLLQKHMYYACMRSHGTAMYMFLIQHENMNVCVFIEKQHSPNHELPRMIAIPFQMHWSLFMNGGTLIDGEMTGQTFLINDIVSLSGQSLFHEKLTTRLQIIQDVLRDNFKSSVADACALVVKKYMKVSDSGIDGLGSELADNFPYAYRAILFKPVSMKFKDMQMQYIDPNQRESKPHVTATTTKLNIGFMASLSQKTVLPVTKIGLDMYRSRNADVLARTLCASLKMQELFAGMPVNKPKHIPCTWSKDFNAWEVVV